MKGTIGYILDGIVTGWISWGSESAGTISFYRNGIKNLSVRVEFDAGEIKNGCLTQNFRISNVPITIEELRQGVSKLEATDVSGASFVLPLWGILKIAHQLSSISQSQVKALNTWIGCFGGKIEVTYPDETKNAKPSNTSPTNGWHFGAVSSDGNVMVGRNGHLFLGQGSNKVVELYKTNPKNLPDRWRGLLQSRLEKVTQTGASFCQLIIPEKSSILSALCPFQTDGASKILQDVAEKCGDVLGCRLVIPYFEGDPLAKYKTFQLGDSHLSTYGAEMVVRGVLAALNLPNIPLEFQRDFCLFQGDLARRYPGDNKEYVEIYTSLDVDGVTASPFLVEAFDPDSGHKDLLRVWHCASAPFPYKVVAMANSFFERGAVSTQLSWWFSRLFKEFHFYWTPDLNDAYLQKIKPDYVICQTIERFLRVVPKC